MKKILSMILSIAIFASCAPFSFASNGVEETESGNQIKNIIYLIPDGGGYALFDFANIYSLFKYHPPKVEYLCTVNLCQQTKVYDFFLRQRQSAL